MILPTYPGKMGPQTSPKPQRKEILDKLLVKHPGYLPGVCGWDLRKNHFSGSSCYVQITPLQVNWIHPIFGLEKLSLEVWYLNPSKYATMPPSQQVFGIKKILMEEIDYLGGGFNYFSFSPLFGEDEPNLTSIFFRCVETTNQL